MFRHAYILLSLLTVAGAGRTELVPLGDWPGDGTRTALEAQGQLIRNCGRILERWDLATQPPTLLDSLILPSPPIDLLDWDGILLVLRDDGVLEARHLEDGWDPPLWTLELSTCATELLRHGRWLLPVSPWMPLLDLVDPRQPVVAQEILGVGGDDPGNFGGFHACFIGDTLVGDYIDTCEPWWEVMMGACWMTLHDDGSGASSHWIPGNDWSFCWGLGVPPVASADHLGLYWCDNRLICFDPSGWSLRQEMDLPEHAGTVCLAGRDSLLMIGSRQGSTLFSVDSSDNPPLQALGTVPAAGDQHLQLADNFAVATTSREVSWIDLSAPTGPSLAATLPAQGPLTGMGRTADDLVVRQRDLRILRPQDGQLLLMASLALPEGEGLAASDRLALAGADSTLLVIDLADPMTPTIAAQIAAPGLGSYCLDNGLAAFVTQGELVVATLEQPDQPVERLRLPVGEVQRLAVGGGVVAVAEDRQTIRLIDARDPEQVHVASVLPWEAGWNNEEVTFCGDRLALAWESYAMGYPVSHLALYDLADPSQASPAGSRLWDGYVLEGLWGSAERLLVAVRLTMIYSTPPDYFLFDDLENDTLAQTAHWTEPFGAPVPDWHLTQGAWLARHDEGGGIRLFFDDSILGVIDKPAILPDVLNLAAAPNPFNPRAWLDLTLSRPGPARLAVYDLLGREVAVLCDGPQPAGTRRVAFDGAGLASGLYLARLEAEGGSRTVKLALVR